MISRLHDEILSIWESGDHASLNPPSYYANWAETKLLEVPWLAWAIDAGLINSDQSAQQQKKAVKTNLREDKKIQVIAALLAAWPSGKVPSGKDLERAASSVGVTVSDDTIRKALEAAQEIAPILK